MKATFLFRALTILALAPSLNACVTSSDVTRGKDDYDDPTNVVTVDNPPPRTVAPAPGVPTAAPNENLEREVDVLKGKVEDEQVRRQKLEEENKRLADELAKAKAPALPPSPAPGASLSLPAPEAAPAVMAPQKTGAPLLWDLSRRNIESGKYKEARVALEELVKSYPKDSRAFYANLAIPMIDYRLENLKDAALGFNQVIDKYPKRSETAIAWFGQGAVFFRMNQRDDAKLFYGETVKRYPKSDAAKLAEKYLARRNPSAPRDLFAAFPDWAEKVR